MTREVTRRVVAAAATAALAALAGCTSTAAEPARSSASAGAPSSTHSAPAQKSAHPKPAVPTPGSLAKPGTSSGSLSKQSFPSPKQLGPGWRYAVDPGDAEEGYAGNGTPALARNPMEIVQTAVPFGCSRSAPMPAPDHALEVDYRLHGSKVIAVRGSFSGPAQARAFFTGRAHNLQGCAGRTGGQAVGPLVARLTRPASAALANDRTPASDPWREVAVLDGDTVALVAMQGDDPLNPAQTRRLVRLLRS